MRFPSYDPGQYPPPDVDLVDAYMTLIGRDERDHQAEIADLPKGSTRRACLRIGQACLLGKRDPLAAQRQVQEARAELDPNGRRVHERRVHSYRSLARLIERRENSLSVQSVRQDQHRQSIDMLLAARRIGDGYLGSSAARGAGRTGHAKGLSAEARILGVLTRKMHPWFMALASLEHHERSKKDTDRNFDIALIESRPASLGSGEAGSKLFNLHRIQAKSCCFGFCGKIRPLEARRRQQKFADTRDGYAPNISLISGCCDFQLPGLPEETGSARTVDDLLIDEYRGDLGSHESALLDRATDHILLMATGGAETGRRGTFGIEDWGSIPVLSCKMS